MGPVMMQVPHLDAIVVPICGGGMTSGLALAAKGLKPDIRIIAAEPTGTMMPALTETYSLEGASK